MIVNRLPLPFALVLPLVFAACGGEGLTLPPEGEAAQITVVAGDSQSGRVGSILGTPLLVRVTDTRDRPVSGATVVFSFPSAVAGQATPASATTGSDGRASSTLTLGSAPGTATGKVAVPMDEGVTPVEVSFTTIALSADANGIAAVSGDAQVAPVNSALPAPLVVEVTDEFGNPVSGVTIGWSVTGGGSVSATSTVTDANGEASVTRTLGGIAGPQTALATADGLAGSPVTFTHTATAGTATGVVKVSGDGQSALVGTELALPLVVQVLDDLGNPIPNRAVTWVTGEGSVNPENTTTDAQGHASTRWTLGPTPGQPTATAVVSGVGTAAFTATATAGAPSASASSVSASPETITAGGTSTITVTVRDASNNTVSGVPVTVASSGTGNSITPASAPSGANGVAMFTFSSTVAETKTITATAGGVAITDQATVTVQKVSSSVEITSTDPEPSTAGQNVTVAFTVEGSGGTPTGDVVVTISDGLLTETCTGTLSSGSGSCSLPVTQPGTGPANRRVITATYAGDAQFSGDTDTQNHRVNPVQNLAPVTQDDSYQTNEDVALVVNAADGVLKNDTDPEGGPLTAVNASDPPNGSVTLAADGSFTYTPDPNFFGDDQFTYRAQDPAGNSTAGTVTIHVTLVNDAPSFTGGPNQSSLLSEGAKTVPDWATQISSGPANESGQVLTFEVVGVTGDASFSAGPSISAADGSLSYTPVTAGNANVTVRLKDNGGGTDTSPEYPFTITIGP